MSIWTGPCARCGEMPCRCENPLFWEPMIDKSIFKVAAKQITDELDSRGFVTETPEGARGLIDKISQIIEETIRGNTNYSHADASAHEIDGDGWESDLQNQIS